MKKLVLLSAVSILALTSADAFAATAEGTGNANAEIVSALEVKEAKQMEFGTFLSPSDGAKTAILNTESDVSGTATPINKGRTAAAGEFNIKGADGVVFSVNLPKTIELKANGQNTMTINEINGKYHSQTTLTGLTLTTGQNLFVGGTLQIGDGQAAGSYTGTYKITVDY